MTKRCREWLISDTCPVCGKNTSVVGRCLNCGWESIAFKTECRMNVICATAKKRMNKACDQIRALRPTESDWMTESELKEFHELQLQIVYEGMTQEEAKERVRRKRLARLQERNPRK